MKIKLIGFTPEQKESFNEHIEIELRNCLEGDCTNIGTPPDLLCEDHQKGKQ